ncbi:MAG: BamA/TamA family outer membrane protein [Fibrobacter sp.]|nr:BamA/TamA family outer membrane protein [Fibrobacter sp.]
MWWKILLVWVTFGCLAQASSTDCQVKKIIWTGEITETDEALMADAVGKSCSEWQTFARNLERYYENNGFITARVTGSVYSSGILTVKLERGAAWVWAAAENLDSSGTKIDVFRRLSGLEPGAYVSVEDLERADQKLSRIGYFEQMSNAKMFRDPSKNRIVPVFFMRAASLSEAEALLTYSSTDGAWEGLINVNLYNILGTARDLSIEGYTGEDSRHLVAYYKEPWILGSPFNVVIRGNFDEETIVETSSVNDSAAQSESIERLLYGEIGVTRELGFDFTIGVYFGLSDDDKHSTFEISYTTLDRFVLPRKGLRLNAHATYKMDRPDTLDNYLAATLDVQRYLPIYQNWIARFSGSTGATFHSDAKLMRSDFFSLGGINSFKGMDYRFLRTRAYGYSEMAFLWQDGYNLSIEIFYQPGLYRAMRPEHGWKREQDYGLALTQYKRNWSVNLYYAMRNGCNYLDGILGVGVKTLF